MEICTDMCECVRARVDMCMETCPRTCVERDVHRYVHGNIRRHGH